MSAPKLITNSLQVIANRTIRGIRDTLPAGYLVGRAGSSDGPAQLISLESIYQAISNKFGGVPKGANPSATAGSTAVNGSAATFMRSDAAPKVALGTTTKPGILQPDGTTITVTSGGVISASGGSGGSVNRLVGVQPFSPNVGSTFSSGFIGLRAMLVDEALSATSVQFPASAASASAVMTPCVFADNGGAPGALLESGPSVTGAAYGVNDLPLTSALALTEGEIVWVGMLLATANVDVMNCAGYGTAYWSASSVPNNAPAASFTSYNWANFWLKGTVS